MQADADNCRATRTWASGITLFSITVKYFLAISIDTHLIDNLHHLLTRKYSMKRLVKPKEFLVWITTYAADVSIT